MTDGDASTYFETPLSTPQNPVAIVVDLGAVPIPVNKMIINNADDSDVNGTGHTGPSEFCATSL